MPSLDRQISESRRAVDKRRQARPLANLEAAVEALAPIRPFTEWVVGEEIAFILRAREPYSSEVLTEAAEFGIAGIAVDTDEALRGTAPTTSLPVLHRGLLVEPYQLFEARLDGAHGVVLIAEALDDDDGLFHDMQAVAWDIGLDVVVQVASEEEIGHVLDLLDPDSFLIRNSDGQGAPDFEHTFSLLEEVPAGKTVISQGGIRTRNQVRALEGSGVDAAMIGRWVCEDGLRASLDMLRGASR
jgi:indole-3-glycerol phosphate synthase